MSGTLADWIKTILVAGIVIGVLAGCGREAEIKDQVSIVEEEQV